MKKNKQPTTEITYRSKQLEVIKKKILAIFEQKKNEAFNETGKPLTIYSLYYKILPERYKDHELIGDFKGCRECHITPDWLLIYEIYEDELILYLTRTGTHSDLF